MNTSEIKYAEVAERFKKLKSNTFDLLERFNKQESIDNLRKSLERLQNRQMLKVAFVGQYNAGKSTIISAITGDDQIHIDSNVATDASSDYLWKGIQLTDTPGILAGKVAQHDEITKQAILDTDLIVYVLTSQLFDDVIFENFIDLAYNQKLKSKMLIAINKMSMEPGDFETLQANYLDSIKTIFKEKGYEFDFDVIFIDAADYIEGQEEGEEDLIELSNFNDFIQKLNDFVEQRGILQKSFDTPSRLLKNAINEVALQEVDPNFELIIKKYESRLQGYKKDVSQKIEFILSSLKSAIVEEGYSITSVVDQKKGEDELKQLEVTFEEFLEKCSTEKMELIENEIKTQRQSLGETLEVLNKDPDIVLYRDQLKNITLSSELVEQNTATKKKSQFLELLKSKTPQLMKYTGADKSSGIFMKASEASGTKAHEIVLKLGKFGGYNFKPWGAANIAKSMGNLSKLAGPVLGGVMLGCDIYGAVKEERKLKKITASKQQMNSEFVEIATGVVDQINKRVKDYFRETIDKQLAEFEKQKQEIVEVSESNSKFLKEAKVIDVEYSDFFEQFKYEASGNVIDV